VEIPYTTFVLFKHHRVASIYELKLGIGHSCINRHSIVLYVLFLKIYNPFSDLQIHFIVGGFVDRVWGRQGVYGFPMADVRKG